MSSQDKKTNIALICSSVLALYACGFEPVYGTASKQNLSSQETSSTESILAQISIGSIPDRSGQFLRNRLVDRMHQQGTPQNPAYALSVSTVREQLIDLDITKTADSTRGQLRIDVTIQLTDTQTGQPVLNRTLRSITSYNILASEFSTRVTEQSARENALTDLARQIEMAIVLHLKQERD